MSGLFDIRNEVILVTGASQGLGRRFARLLAQQGASVVLAARQVNKLMALEDEIKAEGGRAVAVQMDVTDANSIRSAVNAAEQEFGPVTVLVNNAGLAIEKPAAEQTPADWDIVVGTNLKGAFFVATEVARRMMARGDGGNIINIASVLGITALKSVAPYAISKAGVIQATKALALEFAPSNIRVNAIAPGYIDTDINHEVWATPAGERLRKRIPQRRIGEESDLDGALLLLASGASRYMTGSVVTVDGGFLLM